MATDRETGIQALKLGDATEAVRCLERACAEEPSDYRSHLYLGAAYGEGGRISDAVSALRKAVDLAPDVPQCHYNLAVALERAFQADEAVSSLKQALRLQPDHARAMEALRRLDLGSDALPPRPPDTAVPAPVAQNPFMLKREAPAQPPQGVSAESLGFLLPGSEAAAAAEASAQGQGGLVPAAAGAYASAAPPSGSPAEWVRPAWQAHQPVPSAFPAAANGFPQPATSVPARGLPQSSGSNKTAIAVVLGILGLGLLAVVVMAAVMAPALARMSGAPFGPSHQLHDPLYGVRVQLPPGFAPARRAPAPGPPGLPMIVYGSRRGTDECSVAVIVLPEQVFDADPDGNTLLSAAWAGRGSSTGKVSDTRNVSLQGYSGREGRYEEIRRGRGQTARIRVFAARPRVICVAYSSPTPANLDSSSATAFLHSLKIETPSPAMPQASTPAGWTPRSPGSPLRSTPPIPGAGGFGGGPSWPETYSPPQPRSFAPPEPPRFTPPEPPNFTPPEPPRFTPPEPPSFTPPEPPSFGPRPGAGMDPGGLGEPGRLRGPSSGASFRAGSEGGDSPQPPFGPRGPRFGPPGIGPEGNFGPPDTGRFGPRFRRPGPPEIRMPAGPDAGPRGKPADEGAFKPRFTPPAPGGGSAGAEAFKPRGP